MSDNEDPAAGQGAGLSEQLTVMTGVLSGMPAPGDAPDFKGSVVIEWPPAAAKGNAARVLPCRLSAVYDEETGDLIPAAKITVHADASGFITADIGVFLDRQGGIIRDPSVIWRDSDGIPATFTFLVAEMREARDHGRHL